ncbi:hypothetical protein M405DRAFT_813950 [Rhizopogon salebrosus TDB-379]|nr:hypothetical protein M405DRAFT_813950 [Rhizopogon salebrosus TDB-379]
MDSLCLDNHLAPLHAPDQRSTHPSTRCLLGDPPWQLIVLCSAHISTIPRLSLM